MSDLPPQRDFEVLDRQLATLPVCAWARDQVEGKDMRALFADPPARRAYLLARDAHLAGCSICQQRAAVMARLERTVDGGSWRLLGKAMEWVWRRPVWVQPALTGAGVFAAYSMLRIAVAMPFGRLPILTALEGLLLSSTIGASIGLIGGNAYRFFKPRGEGWGPLGPYLAGIGFAGVLGLATALVLLAIPDTSSNFRRPLGWEIVGGFVLVLGIGAGGAWFRKGKGFRLA